MYLDSSAGAKLILEEVESAALRVWLADRGNVVSSALFRAEVVRAARREAPERLETARAVVTRVMLLAIDDDVLTLAEQLEPVTLRSLDAIHLASAIRFGADLDVLVTYDRRMIEAAQQLGLPVASPA